jgi:rhodanese-related sulfurtransferase
MTHSGRFLGFLWFSCLLAACSSSSTKPTEDASPRVGDTAGANAAPDTKPSHPDTPTFAPDSAGSDTSGSKTDTTLPETSAPDATVKADTSTPDSVTPSDTAPAKADTAISDSAALPEAGTAKPDGSLQDASASDGATGKADAIISDTLAAPDASKADATTPDGTKPDDARTAACVRATSVAHLSPSELKALLDSGEDPFLINVKGESIGKIPGTDAVLVNDIPGIEALVNHDSCANIVLYCLSGGTSQSVGSQLIAKGYNRVRDLAGGITAWKAAGYPTE